VGVTIREIAKRAGVSRGTVDRVLNGRPGVKPEVREHVLAIAKELQYVPNLAAKALAYNKNPAEFGVILPPEDILFFRDVCDGIRKAVDELKDMGIRVRYRHVDNRDPAESAAALRAFVEEGASGVLFAAMDERIVRESIDEAAEKGVPVVTVNSDVEQSRRVCFVGQDLHKSGVIAAGLMRRLLPGGGKVAVVTGNMKFHAHRTRVNSFRDGAAGSSILIAAVLECYDRYDATRGKLEQTMKEHPDLAGIYMATGDIAGCIDAVRSAGKAGQLRIVCNDLLPETERGLREGIIDFTITQNPFRQGYQSLRILFDLVFMGKPPEREVVFTETGILIRESL